MTGHARRRPPATARAGERGSVLIMVALSLVVVVMATALTVDLGRVSTRRRDLQNVADAAALDLVRLVDGRTAGAIATSAGWDAAQAATLARNGFAVGGERSVRVRLGSYDVAAEVFTPVASAASVPSAVEVEVTDRVTYEFAPGGSTTSRRAVAANQAAAGIQVGSFAARLDSSQSALLGPLLGDAIGVDLVGYQGLATAYVGLDALATELGLSLASPTALLGTEVTLGELTLAQAAALRRAGDLANADLLEALAADLAAPDTPLTLGDLLTVAAGGAAAAADASLNVLELVTTAAFVANGDSFLTVPALALGVPGVAMGTTSVRVVQPPRWAFGGPGTTVDTAQVTLATELALTAPGLVGVTLSLDLDVASARAIVQELSCGSPQVLGVDVTTGLASVDVGLAGRIAVDLLGLTQVTVAEVTGEGHAGDPGAVGRVDFVLPPDVLGGAKPYSSGGLNVTDVTVDTDVALLPSASLPFVLRAVLGLVQSTAEAVVDTVLVPLVAATLAALDTVLVQPLLSLLGVTLPGADVAPLALRCTGADLVA